MSFSRDDAAPAIPTEVPMRVIGLAVVLAVSLILAPLAAGAEQGGKLYRIGFLSAYEPPTPEEVARSPFVQALRELGWSEGQNLLIERRYASGKIDRLPELAADLVRLNVDVIVAFTNIEIAAARQATSSIPIVMLFATDPVGAGFVAGLSRPGGNITGTTFHTPEVMGKVLQMIKEVVPKVARVAIVWNPDYQRLEAAYIKQATVAAQALGLTLHFVEVRQARDVATAFVKIRNEHDEALYLRAIRCRRCTRIRGTSTPAGSCTMGLMAFLIFGALPLS